MSKYIVLGPWGQKTVEEFMELSQEQQKDVLATLIGWKHSDDLVNDIREAILEVKEQC